jgi:adenine deaminase
MGLRELEGTGGKEMSEKDETFTLREVHEAYAKFVHGEELTEKERELAQAKHLTVRTSLGSLDDEAERLREGIKDLLREGAHSQATHDKLIALLEEKR